MDDYGTKEGARRRYVVQFINKVVETLYRFRFYIFMDYDRRPIGDRRIHGSKQGTGHSGREKAGICNPAKTTV